MAGSSIQDAADINKSCFGCKRNKETGKSFMNPEEGVAWLSGGRGNWCLDCHSLWRTHYSSDYTLPQLQQWLKVGQNQWEFDLALLAHLSLILEGAGRITQGKVIERKRVFKFLLRALGIPAGPMIAMALGEVANMSGFKPDPNALITLRSGASAESADRLGFLVSAFAVRSSESFVPIVRPEVAGCPPALPSRSSVGCSCDADHEQLINLFSSGGASTVPFGAIVKQEVTETTPKKGNRYMNKFNAFVAQPSTIVAKFTSEAWVDVRESSLTKHLSSAHTLNDEVSQVGEKEVSDKCEAWISGLSGLKAFIKAHRDWGKSNSKVVKFMEMLDPLDMFVEFMRKTMESIVAPTLGLLHLKLHFFDEVWWPNFVSVVGPSL